MRDRLVSADEWAVYDRLESRHWWFRGRRDVMRLFLHRVPDRHGKRVLEIGCGSGGNLQLLFGDFAQRVGIDCSEDAVAYAQRKMRPGDLVTRGDANALDLEAESFDCVALLDVLCHRNVGDPCHVLKEAYRVLKPGGYVLITDGAFGFLAGRHSESVNAARRFTKSQLARMLFEAGFCVRKASYWGTSIFFLLVLKRRLFERIASVVRRGRAPATSFDVVLLPIIDRLLYATLVAELPFVRWLDLPFGASIGVLAQKQETG